MQSAVLTATRACALVPHSTRPVWHEWQSVQQQQQENTNKHTARRRLFAEEEPAEEQNQQFVQRLLAELAERYKRKWNFDFEKGRPMECSAGSDQQQQQYEYEAVAADKVPGFYRMAVLYQQHCQQSAYASAAASALGKQQQQQMPLSEEQQQLEEEFVIINDENKWHNNNGIIGRNGMAEKYMENNGEEEEEEQFVLLADGCVDGQLAEQSTAAASSPVWKSPSRVLRKASRRASIHQTPNRNSTDGGDGEAEVHQTKMTDFLRVRKSLSRSCTKSAKAVEDCYDAVENCCSPTKRRRHSLVGTQPLDVPSPRKTIARRSQRVRQQQQNQLHHVRLFH